MNVFWLKEELHAHCGHLWVLKDTIFNFAFLIKCLLIGKKVQLKQIECLRKYMETMLQLRNHVGNDCNVSRMEILAMKTGFVLINYKRIVRQKFGGFTIR